MPNSESAAGTNVPCSIIVAGSERHGFSATHSSSGFDGDLDYMFSATGSALAVCTKLIHKSTTYAGPELPRLFKHRHGQEA